MAGRKPGTAAGGRGSHSSRPENASRDRPGQRTGDRITERKNKRPPKFLSDTIFCKPQVGTIEHPWCALVLIRVQRRLCVVDHLAAHFPSWAGSVPREHGEQITARRS
jgi:hypothetical protein